MNHSCSVHASLETTTVWVKEDIFFDLEQNTDNWLKCKLFGITCLEGRVPTFEVLTQDGYVFSDIPPHMIRFTENSNKPQYSLEDLVYNNCLSEDFVVSEFKELTARTAYVLFKSTGEYVKAQYWFSLDFYKNNNWYHCMKLENGQVAFIPSHKIVFSADGQLKPDHKFPKYKKLRKVFKV